MPMMPLMHVMGARQRRYGVLFGMLAGACVLAPAALWSGTPEIVQGGTYSVFPARASVPSTEAQPTRRDGSRVTLIMQDSTIEYLVTEIARQAHLRPVYNNHNPLFAQRATVRLTNVSATDAFAMALQGTGLEARLTSDGETVVIRPRTAAPEQARVAGGTLVGRVTDSTTGVGLGGAQVRIEGIKLSTVTSDSGNFALKNVPPGDQVLLVRLFGYRPTTRTVTVVDGERTTVRIAMASVPTVLSGVVTTATGLQRKVEVGNDITSINVDSVMRVAPITSVTDLLETRVPGLTVLHSSGDPGNPSRIRIRGVSSVTGNNDPIVIMDGVRVYASQSDSRNNNLAPSNNLSYNTPTGFGVGSYAAPSPVDQIDPSSIETIEVFKGPSASALYGSDAANGVIVITTKHGRAGPTHWNVDLGEGVNWLPGTWPTNYYRFGYDVQNNLGPLCLWNDLSCHVDSLVAFQALNDPRYSVFSHGHDQTASLIVSGGVSTLQYSLTGNAAGDVGNLKLPGIEQQRYEKFYGVLPGYLLRPDNYQTWGISGQLTAQPTSTARVTLTSSLFNSNQQQGSLQQAIGQLEGEYIDPTLLTSAALLQNDVERATSASLTTTNALTLSWQPVPWLPITATGGLNTIQRTDNTYIPFGVNSCAEGNVPAVGQPSGSQCPGDTTGWYGLGRGTSQDKTLTVGTAIPLRVVTANIGVNLHQGSTADVSASTNQLAPGVSVPTSFPTQNNASSFSQSTSAASTYGWYVEPRFNFNSRFFVSPGFRLDGGSASGANAGLTGFPKIDFSYLAVDQSHPLGGILTLFRPRLAFGYAGTQPGPTEKLRLIGANTANGVASLDGSTFVPIVNVTSLGNTQLRPERSHELEGGFDAELWHGRLTLTYTQYNKTRTDAIVPIPVAPSVNAPGVECGGTCTTHIFKNIGVIRNTGTELTVNAQILQSRALSWTVGGNLSNDNNIVVRLNPGQSTIIDANTRIQAGYPLWGTFVLPIAAFADVNHNGIIEPNEIVYGDSAVFVGQANPKYQLNVNTGVTLLDGRLSVNATFAYQNGLTQTNAGALNSGAFAILPNTPGISLTTQAAVVAADCDVVFGLGNCPNQQTLIGITQTVNTFRFNDLSINYDLPKSVSSLFHVPRLALALQGENLGLHTNYRGKDPNVNVFSTNVSSISQNTVGDLTVDAGQVPQPKTWWLKLTVGN